MNVDDFISEIFPRKRQSVWIMVLGKKQSGKTATLLYIMEILYELGLMDYFGSNVPLEDAPFEYDFIVDFETLEERCRMLNPDPNKRGLKKYFYFCSEMGKAFPKDQSWRNIDFIEKLQLVRKYGLNWGGDAISRVDSRILSDIHFDGCIKKLYPTNPTIAKYENWETDEVTYLYDIPMTKIKFDTFWSASFRMKKQNDSLMVPLNRDHEIAFKYLDNECSWKKAGIDTQTGKRAVIATLKAYRDLLRREPNQEPVKNNAVSEPISTE